MLNTWNSTLIASAADGAALTNTTTATSLLLGASKFLMPGGFLLFPGQKLRLYAAGRISTVVTTPGTLTLDFRVGSVVAFNGGAISLNTTAQTNATWQLSMDLQVRAIGSGTTAQILGVGEFTSRAVIGSAAAASGGVGTWLLPDTAPAVGTGFDSTASAYFDLFGTWSVANASNSITCHQFELVSCN